MSPGIEGFGITRASTPRSGFREPAAIERANRIRHSGAASYTFAIFDVAES
jgi:hypothetical protein